jgi:RNA polymerase sigma factor (sigma-70 family)
VRDGGADLERVFRDERGRVLATVVRLVGDLGRAEEIVQEAWLRALEHWPRSGVPDSPRAWLLTTARHLAVDELRRRARAPAEAFEEAAHSPRETNGWDEDLALAPPVIRDDPLRLVFTCCHPALPPEARVALTLRTLGGLTTREIARAFLTSEPTVAQRIVRAKKTLRERAIPYRVPTAWELPERLPAVLEVLYLVFNEGYAAGEGDAPVRGELCEEAIRLARLVVELLPEESEAHGLLALLLLQASRLPARSDGAGGTVLLEEQDRSHWEGARIAAGLAQLEQARVEGPYALQAAIAACHARAARFEATDWVEIVRLYDRLLAHVASPVVALNRALAVSHAEGAERGLALVEALADDPRLRDYPWLPAARADLLRRCGRLREAADDYREALARTHNRAERAVLSRRLAQCDEQAPPPRGERP